MWVGSQKGAPVGSLELPAVKGPQSQQLKSRVVCVRLLAWCVNAWAAASPLTVMLSFSSTSIPKSSSGLLSIHSPPSLDLSLGCPRPVCRTLPLALLNFRRFAWAHLSSLPRSLWMAALPSSLSTAPHSSVSSANLLRVHRSHCPCDQQRC